MGARRNGDDSTIFGDPVHSEAVRVLDSDTFLGNSLVWYSLLISAFLFIMPTLSGTSDSGIEIKITREPLALDDITRLKALTGGIGGDFEPNAEVAAYLRVMAFRWVRCINGDLLPGDFDADGNFRRTGEDVQLERDLKLCESIGASPHIIIGTSVPSSLRVSRSRYSEGGVMGSRAHGAEYWNGDWGMLNSYWRALLQYIIIDRGFRSIRLEVGNEPDIGGKFVRLPDVNEKKGGEEMYSAYIQTYGAMAATVKEFMLRNPGVKIELGGPALAWAYTFRYGDFNWVERFMMDCRKYLFRVDFIGLHYYGNISSLGGNYDAKYPSFSELLENTKRWRDLYLPGVPIIMTEWGASYHTDNSDRAMVNGSHIGAAWSLAFLKSMLEGGVAESILLVATDLRSAGSGAQNIWGWPSLFVNPKVFGRAWPKPLANVFAMIARLYPHRVRLVGLADGVDGIATVDGKRAAVLLWNFGEVIPEFDKVQVSGRGIWIRLSSVDRNASGARLFRRWAVSEAQSNSYSLFRAEGVVDSRCELQLVEVAAVPASGDYRFFLPACSVSFVTLDPL